MKKFLAVAIAMIVWIIAGGSALAADSVWARVSTEIAQELTLERVAFDARLTNFLLSLGNIK